MGKSNNIYNEFKKLYEREQNLNNFLEEEHIKKIESINNIFIERIATDFSKFIKYNIKLTSYSIKIGSYTDIEKSIHANLIKILPFNYQSLIVFSSNFFSVMIEVLFGGNGKFIEKVRKKTHMTSSEKFINEKIMKLIIECYSNAYKEFYSISFINIKILINFKNSFFDLNEIFLINYFNFNINNTEVYFSIFIPLFLIKKINKKEDMLQTKNKITKKNISNSISLNDIYDVELDVTFKLMNFSISHTKLYSLSVGDILSIEKPNRIIAYLEDKPIFFSNYKTFNEQSIVFIEEFIEANV